MCWTPIYTNKQLEVNTNRTSLNYAEIVTDITNKNSKKEAKLIPLTHKYMIVHFPGLEHRCIKEKLCG
jgi:hypothetical protein